MGRGVRVSAGQLRLPFPLPPLAARMRGSATRWLRRARRTLRHRPRHVAAAAAGFVLRWALRIVLPIAGAGVMLHMLPYRAVAGGVHFQVQGTVLTRSGLSADTTFGSWEFPHVTLLPVGVHLRPDDVDVVRLAAAAANNGAAYVRGLQSELTRQLPVIVLWLIGEALLGSSSGWEPPGR